MNGSDFNGNFIPPHYAEMQWENQNNIQQAKTPILADRGSGTKLIELTGSTVRFGVWQTAADSRGSPHRGTGAFPVAGLADL